MLPAGTLLQNRYRVVRCIGQGGMGAVYEAQHEELGHRVALKETFHTEDDSLRRAFKREARMLAGLRHTSLPRVTDYFTEGDGLFLVMEHIKGDDLLEMLNRRAEPFPVPEVLRWANQLLSVLEYLHTQEQPVIHRDIKPNNIKLNERGDVILLDFGLAKGAAGELTSVVASRSVLGFTLAYAPLEQILKADPNLAEHLSVFGADKIEDILRTPTDARSDLYALGATLYHLLTNKLPAQSLTRVLAVWSGKPDPLLPANAINPQVQPSIAALLQKAMALEKEDRPASAAEMRDKLNKAAQPAPDAVLPSAVNIIADLPTVPATQQVPVQPTIPSSIGEAPRLPDSQPERARSNKRFSNWLILLPISLLALTVFLLSFWRNNTQYNTGTNATTNSNIAIPASANSSPLSATQTSTPQPSSVNQTWELTYTLRGHTEGIYSVAFSPDSKLLASGSDDSTVKLWDVTSGRELKTLKGHTWNVISVDFSPDGRTLASGSRDYAIKLWDVDSGRELKTLTGHSHQVHSVAFSPDGKILASGSNDRTAKIWDMTSWRELKTLRHPEEVMAAEFSPDGKQLASCSGNSIMLWDTTNWRLLKTLRGHSNYIATIAFSPDGKLLASGSADSVKLWDVVSGQEVKTLLGPTRSLLSVAFSPDGKILASCNTGGDDTVRLWEVASGRELTPLSGHINYVISVAFSRDGKMLASGGYDSTIKLWRIKE
jgi:eukaryotic-like serine/threonine-protein kinase